jgi:hypothetical protein
VEAVTSTILTAGGWVPLTHTGTAAACLTQNNGTHIYISTEKSTFTNHMTDDIALGAEHSLADMGFAIFRDKSICWLSRRGYISVTDGRAIRMNEGSRTGAYLLDTTNGDGFSTAQNHANFLTHRAAASSPSTPPTTDQTRHGAKRRHLRSRPGLELWAPRPLRCARNITENKNRGEPTLPMSEVMLADKNWRRMETYTYSERMAMAARLSTGVGVIASAYPDTREDRQTDVSLVDLTRFPYSDDNVTDSRLSANGLIRLWQARLGFPRPELMAKILKVTTGHNIDPEKARTLARRTLISTLAHHKTTQMQSVTG